MVKQRLVLWKFAGGSRVEEGPVVVNLDYESLLHEYPDLAKVIGRGRIISHSALFWGPGLTFTFLVDGS